MGQLWFISVKGAVPHSACKFDYADTKYADGWLGFAPSIPLQTGWSIPGVRGKVFTDDEGYRINHGIIFEIPDAGLLYAAKEVRSAYEIKNYVLGVCDCVSFTADVARQCGLGVPLLNLTPYGLIEALGLWNKCVKKWQA